MTMDDQDLSRATTLVEDMNPTIRGNKMESTVSTSILSEQDEEESTSVPSLWQQAFYGLKDEEKVLFKSCATNPDPAATIAAVRQKRGDCERKQWTLYINKNGEEVKVRDVFDRICVWVERFKAVGDVAVSYDPGHAALPWAAIRMFLQTAVNDCQTFGAMLESIERVASIVSRYTAVEARVLLRTSALTSQLSAALLALYSSVWKFLAQAYQYHSKSSRSRAIRSAFQPVKTVVDEPVLHIERLETDVYKLVTLVQGELTNASLDDILQSIKKSIPSPHLQVKAKRQQISAWINGIVSTTTYDTSLGFHQEGTCEWVLNIGQYCEWISCRQSKANQGTTQSSSLWIYGPPGFGKTIMSAYIIENIVKADQGPVAYFFCVGNNNITRHPYSILKSWLCQILSQIDDAEILALEPIFSAKRNQPVGRSELWELFVTIGERIPGCMFVVDGFDECIDIKIGVNYHSHEPRSDFLRDLMKCLRKTKSSLLLVSRDEPDIRQHLGKPVEDEERGRGYTTRMFEYGVTAANTSGDVQKFCTAMIEQRLPKKPAGLKKQLAEAASKRSEGMFLWAFLLKGELCAEYNKKVLKNKVENMPSGIGEAYARKVDMISNLPKDKRAEALAILRWVLFAVRPLRVKELAEALAVSGQDELEEYPRDDLPDSWEDTFVDEDYVNGMILGRCGSLLHLRSSSPDEQLADHRVHFVHFSVKEHLLRLPPSHPLAEDLGVTDIKAQELRLSQICLRYLDLDSFRQIPGDTDAYPFLSYAAWAWYSHGFHGREMTQISEDIMSRTHKIFNPNTSSWRVWSPVLEAKFCGVDDREYHGDIDDDDDDDDYYTSDDDEISDTQAKGVEEFVRMWPGTTKSRKGSWLSTKVQSPLYYASLLGLTEIIKWLEDQGLDCTRTGTGGWYGTALQAAVARGHHETVLHLIHRGVDVSQTGGRFGAAIITAAALANADMADTLLQHGADVMAKDERGWTALHHAAKRGSTDWTEALLQACPDGESTAVDMVGTTNNAGLTALDISCKHGKKEVVAILLPKIDERDAAVMALGLAIVERHEELACQLLDAGVPMELSHSPDFTPLLLAITESTPKVVNYLLSKNASVDRRFENGRTCLHQAVAISTPDIIKALLDAGADVNSADDQNIRPLHIAAIMNRSDVVSMLLDRGAEAEVPSHGNASPLILAVDSNALEAAETLLARGARPGRIAEHTQSTAFDIAVETGADKAAALLVRYGALADPGSRDSASVPIRPRSASLESKGTLLPMKVYDLCQGLQDTNNLDPSELAAAPPDELTPALRIAAAMGRADLVKDLLAHTSGASSAVNRKDISGRTAIHYAVRHGHLQVADLLVRHGASVMVEDDAGSTPIDLAVAQGQEALGFIKNHMGELTMSIIRRPSLLEYVSSGNSGAENATAASIRRAISGPWSGHYEYLSWAESSQEPFAIQISSSSPPPPPPSHSDPGLAQSSPGPDLSSASNNTGFSSIDNHDDVGPFEFHGFVDQKGIIWFAKLYPGHGWLYRGQVVGEDMGEIRGTWGSNRKLWFGTFSIKRTADG